MPLDVLQITTQDFHFTYVSASNLNPIMNGIRPPIPCYTFRVLNTRLRSM
jgi:hypothetical protein